MISLRRGFLFIHIPKTAGNAIQNVLRQYSEEKIVSLAAHHDGIERFEIRSDTYSIRKHSSLAEYVQQLGKNSIDPLFRFTCIRNPWDRMISFYFSPHRGGQMWDRKNFIKLIGQVKTVPEFISLGDLDKRSGSCFDNMNFYMRYESLDADFERACRTIGIPSEPLPMRNVSERKRYSAYYDKELIDLVAERFRDEVQYFGYDFDQV